MYELYYFLVFTIYVILFFSFHVLVKLKKISMNVLTKTSFRFISTVFLNQIPLFLSKVDLYHWVTVNQC